MYSVNIFHAVITFCYTRSPSPDGETEPSVIRPLSSGRALGQMPVAHQSPWAISAPRSIQTAAQTLAQKAIAAGIEGHQVDGNDVMLIPSICARALIVIPRRRREAVERQATGGALFDKIEFDRGRSVRCPIRISVRRGEYPPRFRSTSMMVARCRARRASTSLYPIASYGELSVCIPLSLLQMGRVVYSERVQITFGESNDADFVIVSSLPGEPTDS
jgi:hypothetical protein